METRRIRPHLQQSTSMWMTPTRRTNAPWGRGDIDRTRGGPAVGGPLGRGERPVRQSLVHREGWLDARAGGDSIGPAVSALARGAQNDSVYGGGVWGGVAWAWPSRRKAPCLHGTMRIGNATLEIAEAQGEFQPMPCHLHVYVPDTRMRCMRGRWRQERRRLKCRRTSPMGDRSAGVKRPMGE